MTPLGARLQTLVQASGASASGGISRPAASAAEQRSGRPDTDRAEFSAAGRAALLAEEVSQAAEPESATASPLHAAPDKEDDEAPALATPTGIDGEALAAAELQLLRQLGSRDREVRIHEQAHIAAAGGHARGGPRFDYQTGPDGARYAVGGEVSIDTGEEATPEATIRKMVTVRRAALAPAEPSAADRSIAQAATQKLQAAQLEVLQQQLAAADSEVLDRAAATRLAAAAPEEVNEDAAGGIDLVA